MENWSAKFSKSLSFVLPIDEVVVVDGRVVVVLLRLDDGLLDVFRYLFVVVVGGTVVVSTIPILRFRIVNGTLRILVVYGSLANVLMVSVEGGGEVGLAVGGGR